MVNEYPVYRLVELPERLEDAESLAERGVEKGKEVYFKSAYARLENCWCDAVEADRMLSQQYSNNKEDFSDDPILNYSINLDELTEESSRATIGLALPRYFELLKETEEEIERLAKNTGLNPEKYLSSKVLPKES